jgi:hypothetical protein
VKFVCVESDKDFIVKEACDDQSDQISFVVILQRATMGDNGNNFSQFLANDPLPTGPHQPGILQSELHRALQAGA